MTQDLLYYESGYFDPALGYYVYTADAESAVTSTSTMTVAVGIVKSAESSLTVTATVTATISHIEGADLFAIGEAALAIEVKRIRGNNIAASSAFTIATDASRTLHFSADDFSNATILVGDNLRVRYSEAATSAAFSLAADVELVPGGEVIAGSGTWSSSTSIEIHAYKKANIINADVTSTFTISPTANRIRFGSTNLEIQAFLSSSAIKTVVAELNVQLSTSVAIPGERILQGSSTEDSAFTPTVTCQAVLNSFAILESTVSLSSSLIANKILSSSATSAFTQSITVSKYLDNNIIASSTSSVNAVISTTKLFDSTFSSSSSITATVGLIKQGTSSENSLFTPSIVCIVIRNSFAVLESTSSLSINGIKTASAISNNNSVLSLSSTPNKIQQLNSELTSSASIYAYGHLVGKRPRETVVIGTQTSITSAQSVLGGSSLYIAGGSSSSENRVIYEPSGDFVIPQNTEFNIELFFRPTTKVSNRNILSLNNGGWRFFWGGTNSVAFQWSNENGLITIVETSAVLSTNTWYYFRIYRDSTSYVKIEYASFNGSSWSSISQIGSHGYPTYGNVGGSTSGVGTALYFGASATQSIGYYDEVYIASGSSERQQFQVSGTPNRITAGPEPTTVALFHFDTDYSDDMHGIAKAQAALTPQATLSANPTKLVVSTAPISSQASLNALGSKVVESSANISSSGSLLIVNSRLRPFASLEDTAFTLSASTTVSKLFELSLESTVTTTVTASNNIVASSSLSSQSILTATACKTTEIILLEESFGSLEITAIKNTSVVSNNNSNFTINIIPEAGKLASAGLNSAFTQTTEIIKTLGPITSALSSISSASIQGVKVTDVSSSITSNGGVVAAFGHIRPFASLEDTAFTISTSARSNKVATSSLSSQISTNVTPTKTFGPIIITASSTSSLSSTAKITSGSIVNASSQTTLASSARTNKTLTSALSSQFVITINAREESDFGADLTSAFTQSTQAIKNSVTSANLESSTALNASVKRIRAGISLEFAFADAVVDADVIRNIELTTTAISSLLINPKKLSNATANLTCEGFILAIGREVLLDSAAVYVVPAETRTWSIPPEITEYRIQYEVREFTIKD